MTDYSRTAEALSGRTTFEGTVDIDGEALPIKVQEPTIEGLEEIEEERTPEDADEVDIAKEMINEYLVEPDISAASLGVTRALKLFAAMQETFQQAGAVAEARDEMPLDEGNQ